MVKVNVWILAICATMAAGLPLDVNNELNTGAALEVENYSEGIIEAELESTSMVYLLGLEEVNI